MTNYDRIRVLWPDHLGLARGKYLPARLAPKGTGHAAAVFSLGYDRSMNDAPGAFLMGGFPDLHATLVAETLRQGWDDEFTGVAIADLTMGGEPYRWSARYALQRAIADLEELGYRAKVGLELEAYVLEPNAQGGWQRYQTPSSMVYGTGPGADPRGVITAVTREAEASGFLIESINAEYDEGQFELTLEYDDALRAVDDAFLFRVLAREVAMAMGLDMTFLGKPFSEISGSGVHVNFSLIDADERNVFNDDEAEDGLSTVARSALGGLVRHHQALAALCAPTVNAYRRLQPASINGYWANWGLDHRCAANRIPPSRGQGTRIENRVGDGAMNLHLGVAAVLQAARLGIVGEVDPGEPLITDGLEDINTDVHVGTNLAAALDHLAADTVLTEAVGSDLVANFMVNKRAEWDRYLGAVGTNVDGPEVTDWELTEYLPYH